MDSRYEPSDCTVLGYEYIASFILCSRIIVPVVYAEGPQGTYLDLDGKCGPCGTDSVFGV